MKIITWLGLDPRIFLSANQALSHTLHYIHLAQLHINHHRLPLLWWILMPSQQLIRTLSMKKNITFFKKFFLLFPCLSQNSSQQFSSFICFYQVIPRFSLTYLFRVFLYFVRSPNIDILYTYGLIYIKLRAQKMFISLL